MSPQSKGLSTGKTALSTGGWGTILNVLVGAVLTDPSSVWRTVAYALVPGAAVVLTYVISWFISRHGSKSPEDAAKRAKCKRDLTEIERRLNSERLTPGVEARLIQAKAKTIEILVSIGSDSIPEASSRSSQLPDTAGLRG